VDKNHQGFYNQDNNRRTLLDRYRKHLHHRHLLPLLPLQLVVDRLLSKDQLNDLVSSSTSKTLRRGSDLS